MADAAPRDLVSKSSERFQQVYARVGAAVRKAFPKAEESVAYKMPGWRMALPPALVPKDFKGTMDPRAAYVLLKEGKSGITLHVWNPLDYNGLDQHRERLEAAGFDVMVGCIRWTRKSDYPIKEVEDVLRGMKARLNPKTG